jgi:hypothetical protein
MPSRKAAAATASGARPRAMLARMKSKASPARPAFARATARLFNETMAKSSKAGWTAPALREASMKAHPSSQRASRPRRAKWFDITFAFRDSNAFHEPKRSWMEDRSARASADRPALSTLPIQLRAATRSISVDSPPPPSKAWRSRARPKARSCRPERWRAV